MESLLHDIKFSVRMLLKAPAFTIVAILTLALGIGANTAIFSVINAVLLRPLPFHEPDRLVQLWETEAAPGTYPFAGPDYLDWQAQNHTLEATSLYTWGRNFNASGAGQPEPVLALNTQANFFSVLGVRPFLGRTFVTGEDQAGKNRVVIVSYGIWQRHFGRDPGVLGRTLNLDSEAYSVIGVMPRGFRFPSQTEIWIPLDMSATNLGSRGSHSFRALGRLKPGVTDEHQGGDGWRRRGQLRRAIGQFDLAGAFPAGVGRQVRRLAGADARPPAVRHLPAAVAAVGRARLPDLSVRGVVVAARGAGLRLRGGGGRRGPGQGVRHPQPQRAADPAARPGGAGAQHSRRAGGRQAEPTPARRRPPLRRAAPRHEHPPRRVQPERGGTDRQRRQGIAAPTGGRLSPGLCHRLRRHGGGLREGGEIAGRRNQAYRIPGRGCCSLPSFAISRTCSWPAVLRT